MDIIKRDGSIEKFDMWKIFTALKLAEVCANENISSTIKTGLEEYIIENITSHDFSTRTVTELEELVCQYLRLHDMDNIVDSYLQYRDMRTASRDSKKDLLDAIGRAGGDDDRKSPDVNANVGGNFGAKLLKIASTANKAYNLSNIPKKFARAHEVGDLHIHDADSYNLTMNCLNIPIGKLLKSGFNTGYGSLKPAKRIESAVELACIIYQSSQNNLFGGQGCADFSNDMAPFVELTRKEIINDLYLYNPFLPEYGHLSAEQLEWFDSTVAFKLDDRVGDAMRNFLLNLNTMHSRSGSQIVFSSINMGMPNSSEAALIEEKILERYERGFGIGEQFIFPNIIYRVKSGVNKNESDPYHFIFRKACEVASKRMNPTFSNMDVPFNKAYVDRGILPTHMGCRTSIMSNCNGEDGGEGRGNIAPITINLPRLAIKASRVSETIPDRVEYFKHELMDKLYLCTSSLIHRVELLSELKAKDLPFSIGQGLMVGSEGLGKNDSIMPVIKHGTLGIGFIGLAETLQLLIGAHHGETDEARELGLEIVKIIHKYCEMQTEALSLNFSCYATPAEGLSGRFSPIDEKQFGTIDGINNKGYYTNSFHIPVSHNITIHEKMKIEGEYHKYCTGGFISYAEVDNNPTPAAIMDIVLDTFDNSEVGYMGINFHIRYCRECGEMLRAENIDCTVCGSSDIQGVSRVTGYLSLDERFGPGKSSEKRDRVSHISGSNSYGINK